MPKPIEVYENPGAYWHLITTNQDRDFEDQHFDRKEAGRPEAAGHLSSGKLHEIIVKAKETISAFANTNPDGGLLVIGVSTTGEVKGLSHVNDGQRNNLMDCHSWLSNHDSKTKLHDCTTVTGPGKVCLIYTPYSPHAICETPDRERQAWRRQGAQNFLLTADQKDTLRRDKGITVFENEKCCDFDKRDLDNALLAEFRKVFLVSPGYAYSDEELLYHAGAVVRDGDKYIFNNAGFLFFSSNPQRLMSWSYIRLLRFEAVLARASELGLVSDERKFTGPLPTQIRNIRAYFQESGFFKKYQIRNPGGSGFIEQPEFPLIALDEVVVNAVVHRDYAVHLPTECKRYTDAFVEENPGRVLQRDQEVPSNFSLSQIALVHTARNPKILEWFKVLRDEHGAEFVRAISEGTRRMRDEMDQLNLPSPEFHVSSSATKVTLLNNVAERESALKSVHGKGTEFTNLYPLQITGGNIDLRNLPQARREILTALSANLEKNGWFIDRASYGRIVAHKRGSELPLPTAVSPILRMYPAFSFQPRQFWDLLYLTVDFELQVKSVLTASELVRMFPATVLIGRSAIANWNGWQRGKIIDIDEGLCTIKFFDLDAPQGVPAEKVIPNIKTRMLDEILVRRGVTFDLGKAIKQASLASQPNAARSRSAKTDAAVADVASTIFPLKLSTGPNVSLEMTPAPISRDGNPLSSLNAATVNEPVVEFQHQKVTANIREGITQFGAWDSKMHDIELIPMCADQSRDQMTVLIQRLKAGKFKFKGAERTFSTKFSYSSIITAPTTDCLVAECDRVLGEHPTWQGNTGLNRLFLIQTPESGYSLDDENSPYYNLKRSLLEKGIPSQMVDTPTLLNPDFKDLNLALNIIAKCGVVPWVLPGAIPDADFFVGLSYTQNYERGTTRTMGYANVFNNYGRWGFYSANTDTFPFEKKAEYFSKLVQATLEKLTLSDTPSIYFHYSAKFSREDRDAIIESARKVRPLGTYSFVWINTDHNVRFYDSRSDGDGSLRRGSFVATSPRQIYLSTTGYNTYRKILGTPQMLELNIFSQGPDGKPRAHYDLRALASQILSLTKLNWASTDSLCGEPITTKYAGDIAYLTAAFLRQKDQFNVHAVLERTPWFI
jgi:predicted HTH transcriptional regulator